MRELKNIDVAFIPMNLPYTMPPDEAAAAVKAFKPKIAYRDHCRESDTTIFASAKDQDSARRSSCHLLSVRRESSPA